MLLPLVSKALPVAVRRGGTFLGPNAQLLSLVRGAKGAAKAGKGAIVKPVLDVETDTHKLVSEVCGAQYRLEGDPVLIKDDSEYPDWLFKMNIERPEPELEDVQEDTIEYWKRVEEAMNKRHKRKRSFTRKK